MAAKETALVATPPVEVEDASTEGATVEDMAVVVVSAMVVVVAAAPSNKVFSAKCAGRKGILLFTATSGLTPTGPPQKTASSATTSSVQIGVWIPKPWTILSVS
jgi:hypothetical protein